MRQAVTSDEDALKKAEFDREVYDWLYEKDNYMAGDFYRLSVCGALPADKHARRLIDALLDRIGVDEPGQEVGECLLRRYIGRLLCGNIK